MIPENTRQLGIADHTSAAHPSESATPIDADSIAGSTTRHSAGITPRTLPIASEDFVDPGRARSEVALCFFALSVLLHLGAFAAALVLAQASAEAVATVRSLNIRIDRDANAQQTGNGEATAADLARAVAHHATHEPAATRNAITDQSQAETPERKTDKATPAAVRSPPDANRPEGPANTLQIDGDSDAKNAKPGEARSATTAPALSSPKIAAKNPAHAKPGSGQTAASDGHVSANAAAESTTPEPRSDSKQTAVPSRESTDKSADIAQAVVEEQPKDKAIDPVAEIEDDAPARLSTNPDKPVRDNRPPASEVEPTERTPTEDSTKIAETTAVSDAANLTESTQEATESEYPPENATDRQEGIRDATNIDPISRANEATSSGPSVAATANATASEGERVAYKNLLGAWLARHKRYPHLSQKRGQQGKAVLYVMLDNDGGVIEKRIEQSSTHKLLDREVEALVDRAEPLPAPPVEIRESGPLIFLIPIEFTL